MFLQSVKATSGLLSSAGSVTTASHMLPKWRCWRMIAVLRGGSPAVVFAVRRAAGALDGFDVGCALSRSLKIGQYGGQNLPDSPHNQVALGLEAAHVWRQERHVQVPERDARPFL
jgi:hypothetical protein